MTTVDAAPEWKVVETLYGRHVERVGPTPLPPPPSGGWTWDHLTPAEQALLRPPVWTRPKVDLSLPVGALSACWCRCGSMVAHGIAHYCPRSQR